MGTGRGGERGERVGGVSTEGNYREGFVKS